MAGKDKYAQKMAEHLGEPVDGACPITHPGGTAKEIGAGVGGLVGAAIASKGKKPDGDLKIPQMAWLGVTPTYFVITNTSFTGKPKGDPLAKVVFTDVAQVELTPAKLTHRVDVLLRDDRLIAFEVKSKGQGQANVDVCELLKSRVNPAG